MSSMKFYKIPYEGKIESILKLIKDRDWDLTIKFPENGILFMKVPIDIDEEVAFNENLVFDEETNTKFCSFIPITETEFEEAKNLENLESKPSEKENKEINKADEIKSNENNLFSKESKKKTLNFFSEESDKPKENEKLKSSYSFKNYIPSIPNININLKEFSKEIGKRYKEPYDFIFTQKYLIFCFIIAVIFLILFG